VVVEFIRIEEVIPMAFRREVYSQRSTRLNSANPYQIRPPATSPGGLLSSSHLIPPAPAHRPAFKGSEPDGPINEYGIYCGNLAWDVTSEMLKEYLSLIGPVESCEVFLNYDGRSKGSGLAKFESKESATRAINELNDTDFHGRLLQVTISLRKILIIF
jgi:RNA recognition motif-containing protein